MTLKEISNLIYKMDSQDEIFSFLSEILTAPEISTLSKRWRILELLAQGCTQREISKQLNVSLCKVTRGSKILKNRDTVTSKHFIKEKYNGN